MRSQRPTGLVIDDDADYRSMLTIVLERAGFRCLTAASYPAALAVVAAGIDPDLVVTELDLGSRSGLDVRTTLAGVPMILISSDPDAASVAAAAGFTRFFRKTDLIQGLGRAARQALGLPLLA